MRLMFLLGNTPSSEVANRTPHKACLADAKRISTHDNASDYHSFRDTRSGGWRGSAIRTQKPRTTTTSNEGFKARSIHNPHFHIGARHFTVPFRNLSPSLAPAKHVPRPESQHNIVSWLRRAPCSGRLMLNRIDGEILPQDFICILIDVRGVAVAKPSRLIAWFEALSIQTSCQPAMACSDQAHRSLKVI
ncbi:hypothetical protein DL98DRAFT_320252 [Cadophora sp. DSE1049]|nr:hypothetical protein DL98DRAFT_320252 [Cadophora sp. DSE1049]